MILPIKSQTQETDTLRLVDYNVGNYGLPASTECPLLNTTFKHAYLRTILKYLNPDILGLVKITSSPTTFTTDTVINKVLNSYCDKCYAHAEYTNNSGYYKTTMLYYKTSKLGYKSTTTIYSGDPNISDINLHELYYKSANLSKTHDTVFINVILIHDESGSGSAEERATETGGAMSWMNGHIKHPGNYFFMGDFNTQSSGETCYQDMINPSNTNIQFYDPVNQPGNWSDNPSDFVNILTQSTRTTDPGDCLAVGGINNRYDLILCTQPVINDTYGVKYIPGSCRVIGQDGKHTGIALTDAPTNTSVPSNVLNALYYMSEHLPVMMNLQIDYSTSVVNNKVSPAKFEYNSLVKEVLNIKTSNGNTYPGNGSRDCKVIIYDIKGKMIFRTNFEYSQGLCVNTANFSSGIYFLNIFVDEVPLIYGKFVKVKD